MSWYNALEYWLITTVVKWALSREQHSQRDDEEENTGSGKSIARILTGTRALYPWWVPQISTDIFFTYINNVVGCLR